MPLPHLSCFGTEIAADDIQAFTREWLVTNGLGGYASGTIGGAPTSRYHGHLIAALKPPVERTLLVGTLEDNASYLGHTHALWSAQHPHGLSGGGHRRLMAFGFEGTTPVWHYALADAVLEKRVWMEPGHNTTYVRYTLGRASAPLTLHVRVRANPRDHHGNTHIRTTMPHLSARALPHGVEVNENFTRRFYLFSDVAQAQVDLHWRMDYHLSVEAGRGLDALDDQCAVATFAATLKAGDSCTLIFSTEEDPSRDGAAAYARRQAYEAALLAQGAQPTDPEPIRRLVLAADQFIVSRPLPNDPDGQTVIAGYPWFNDWGRDTMIALPGLTLAVGRPEVAARIVRTFAAFVSQGMLPNNFPDQHGDVPGYNTVDATLWYVEAVRAYTAHTGDVALARELFPILQDIITWHIQGTRYHIHRDPADGLLYSGEDGVQLTWMDVKIEHWVVTPRTGKAVEINALWHNALCTLAELAAMLGHDPAPYVAWAASARTGFARFWNPDRGYCYDVLDGPHGSDPTLRPNQLFALSLHHNRTLLTPAQQHSVLTACAQHLLTPFGLRSLAPSEPGYMGHYNGDRITRDAAYHQGTVWGWLIGPWVSAHWRVHGDAVAARAFVEPLYHHLSAHGLGTVSEVFDGDPPHAPYACLAQAWSVSEILRVWRETA